MTVVQEFGFDRIGGDLSGASECRGGDVVGLHVVAPSQTIFQEAQRGRMEAASSKARLVEDIAQSRELMAHADFLLTLPYVK